MTSRKMGAVCVAVGLLVASAEATSPTGASTPTATTQVDTAVREADALVDEWVVGERIPGAVLLVSRDGDVLFERAYGWAQIYDYRDGQYGASVSGEPRPSALRQVPAPPKITTDTAFDLASVTKVMATTLAVMLLVDEGKLELEAPVRTYLPDFGGAAPASSRREPATDDDDEPPGPPTGPTSGKQAITLRHLLTHRAGLHQWKPVYYHADDAEDAYEYIRDLPLAWDVGAERHYSDLGFMLLGLVVERVTGRELGEFLEERFYGPLGLSSTGFRPAGPTASAGPPPTPGSSGPSASGPVRAFAATSHGNPYEHRMVHDPEFGYRIEGDPNAWDGWRRHTLAGEVNDGNAFHAFNGTAGHAGLFSTAADLQVLLQLMLNRGEYGGRRYVSTRVVDSFLTTTGGGQALGWQVPDDAPPGSFVHTGFTGTYVLGVPTENLSVILLTNRQNLGVDDSGRYPDIGELQRGLAGALTR